MATFDSVSDQSTHAAAALIARRDAIADALAANPTAGARAQLKLEIIGLFRDADAAATRAVAFKDSVKELVSTWKSLDATASPSSLAPQQSGRVDHLGASTFLEKGWSKLSVGDAVGAEVALRRALELSPDDNEAETLLGWALMSQEQLDAALATFRRVLQRDPDHALARTNVGYLSLRKRDYGDAIEQLSHAIRESTDHKATLYAHLYLGMVYKEREMYDDAEAFFQRTLELGPNMLQAWYELGCARWFAGQRDRAMLAWREGAAANKFNPWGKRCAEILLQVEQGGSPPR